MSNRMNHSEQTTLTADHWQRASLLERARALQQLTVAGNGSASELLESFPRHSTMLAYRSESGIGELHERFADLFFILDGSATVITGGEIVKASIDGQIGEPRVERRGVEEPGEIRGPSITGTVQQVVRTGDVIHIPAGLPHQMLLKAGETVTYFVMKIEETELKE